ncbi:alpha/beta hydrolase [Novosphingobium sp. P6W]|uniref:alpha/beta hydrolase n=1 Tax=Novosphingobium sp. P6W TaxID=1609758 RepID=UPI0005C5C09C|nr:alpha/beta hydrolase [Novosphingobium sp. P6W]AXB78380.1 alpha/beta hydrolase [Novosphingobium sp. P6W]
MPVPIARGRSRRLALGAAIVVALGLGVAASLTSPPGLLSFLDGIMGGGIGAEKSGSGIAFGTHGQKLDVWRPARTDGRPLPVLVFWYGGGWVKGSRGAYAFAGRAFARQGFLVVVPDYRKVPDVRFPAFLVDGAQAVRWTRDHARDFGGDPGRIAIGGHSAGAYTAAMLALDPQWLRDEGVATGTIKAAVGLCGPYDFYPFTAKRAIDAMKGARDPQATQPIHFARADAPPMLLVSAGNDVEVGAHNANNLMARLHALGGRAVHIDYPGLSHEDVIMAVSVPFRSKGPVLADSVRFLRENMARSSWKEPIE